MPQNQDEWPPLLLVDSPAVSLPSDVCVFSTIPEVEAYRFAAYWMAHADRAAETLEAVVNRTPPLENRRMQRKETYRVFMEDVWDPTYDRYHQALTVVAKTNPSLTTTVEQFFYRFSH
jgi:hypothetical protein